MEHLCVCCRLAAAPGHGDYCADCDREIAADLEAIDSADRILAADAVRDQLRAARRCVELETPRVACQCDHCASIRERNEGLAADAAAKYSRN